METIFLDFLNRGIAAGWMILAVIVLRFLLKRVPKWIHCLLWGMVAVRLACPFSLESIFSLIPSRETVRHGGMISSAPVIDTGVRFVDNAVNPVIRQVAAPVSGSVASSNPLQTLLVGASIVWAVGVGILLLYALLSYGRLRFRLGTAVRLDGNVMLSEFVDTPFIFGMVKPRIYIPSGMPQEWRVPVVAHEMAHLRRHDNLWKILGYILLALYWFHPLCWAAYVLFCRDIELACDEKVIRNYDMHQKKQYSEALLACSQERRAALVCPLAFGEVGAKERIKSVLHYKKPAFWAVGAAVVICVVAAVCFLTDPVKGESGSGEMVSANGSAGNGSANGIEGGGLDNGSILDNGSETGDNLNNGSTLGTISGIGDIESGDEAGGSNGGGQTGNGGGEAGNSEAAGGLGGSGAGSDRADGGAGSGSSQGEAEDAAQAAMREKFVGEWVRAFVERDGNAVETMMTESLAAEWLEGPKGQRSFGESSPWPWDAGSDAYILNIGEESAEIRYYAWTSDPHVTVWKETIFYELQDGKYVITEEELFWLDDISTSEEFGEAYGYIPINGSPMDYESNGAGESLNTNAQLSSSWFFRGLFEPESAAVTLLNLSDDPSEVQLERVYEETGSVNLYIHFLKETDGLPMPVTMAQPYGENGIWVPKSYSVDPVARLMKLDWDEVRSRKLRLVQEPGIWTDIICIAEVPGEDIKIYGYNDVEWDGEGVAIDIDGVVSYFDWIYTSPRSLMPVCYWNEGLEQLQVALNIYTGTGAAAQELHVLQRDGAGTLSDNALELNDYGNLLQERIHFTFDKETGRLTLFDAGNQKELASVTVEEEGVEGLELGYISKFLLGDEIALRVEPGYYTEEGWIAEYPEDMPMIEAQLLLTESGGMIQFELGEIRTAD